MSPPGAGSPEPLQEHELEGQWRVFLLIGVAGFFLGILFITGPLCWIQGRRLRRGYEALAVPVPQGAIAVESLGVLSSILVLLLIPLVITYMT